jgi:hypothetical protein
MGLKRQTLVEIDNDLCKIKVELVNDWPVPFVHCEMKSWGKREAKLIQFVCNQIRGAMKDMGYTTLLTLIPDDSKVRHFNELCGMVKIADVDGLILMKTEV